MNATTPAPIHPKALYLLLVFLFAFGSAGLLYDLLHVVMVLLGDAVRGSDVGDVYRAAHDGGEVSAVALGVRLARGGLLACVGLCAFWLNARHRWAWYPLCGGLVLGAFAMPLTWAGCLAFAPALAVHFDFGIWAPAAAIQLFAVVVLVHRSTRAAVWAADGSQQENAHAASR